MCTPGARCPLPAGTEAPVPETLGPRRASLLIWACACGPRRARVPVTPAAPLHLRRATNWTARSCSPELRAVLARGRSREVGCGALICSQAGQKDG